MERESQADDEILIGVPVRAHRVIVERVEGVLSRDVRGYDFVPRVIEIGVRDEQAWLEPATDRTLARAGRSAAHREPAVARARRAANDRAATQQNEGETHEPAAHGAR